MMNLILVNVNYVADILESEKGNAHRQQYHIHIEMVQVEGIGPICKVIENLIFGMEQIIADISEEIGVLEIEEHRQIDKHASGHP